MPHSPIRDLSRCALFAALLCVCAWVAIPLPGIAMTMQTLGIFLTLGLLGGKWGSVTILVYLLLGITGLPVFTGFQGGIGVLLGATGGYIWGFLLAGPVYWAITALLGNRPWAMGIAMAAGLLCCYGCGTAWYALAYLGPGGSVAAVLAQCVLPYILPDSLKLALALGLTQKLGRFIR